MVLPRSAGNVSEPITMHSPPEKHANAESEVYFRENAIEFEDFNSELAATHLPPEENDTNAELEVPFWEIPLEFEDFNSELAATHLPPEENDTNAELEVPFWEIPLEFEDFNSELAATHPPPEENDTNAESEVPFWEYPLEFEEFNSELAAMHPPPENDANAESEFPFWENGLEFEEFYSELADMHPPPENDTNAESEAPFWEDALKIEDFNSELASMHPPLENDVIVESEVPFWENTLEFEEFNREEPNQLLVPNDMNISCVDNGYECHIMSASYLLLRNEANLYSSGIDYSGKFDHATNGEGEMLKNINNQGMEMPLEVINTGESSFLQTSNGKKKRKASEIDGHKSCNCKRSKCLKLYCECFAVGLFCNEACACQGCSNNSEHEEMASSARQLIETRNPLAFEDNKHITPPSGRHKRGCNCLRSKCLKKYCECYHAGVGCSLGCRCEGCKNTYGIKGEASKAHNRYKFKHPWSRKICFKT